MKIKCILLVILCLQINAFAQEKDLGIFAGMSNYDGTLQPKQFTFFESLPSIGFFYKEEIKPQLYLRFMLTFAQISGDDKYSPDSNVVLRNLSFHSNITEFQTGLEYNFLDLSEHRVTPYIFASLAIFHFNPTAIDTAGNRVNLQPLNTEGEGLKEYPGKKAYSLTQISIPFGGGFKFAVNDHLLLGIEFGLRKTFTGFLDDVNDTYADQSILLSERGPEAVSMAFRTNRLPGHTSDPYPPAGTSRGSGKFTDWYYTAGLTLSYRFGSTGGFNNQDNGKTAREVKCPSYK